MLTDDDPLWHGKSNEEIRLCMEMARQRGTQFFGGNHFIFF